MVVKPTGLLMSLRYPVSGESATWGEGDPIRRVFTSIANRIRNSIAPQCIFQLQRVSQTRDTATVTNRESRIKELCQPAKVSD